MRIARNETLNPEEQALYRARIDELDQEEATRLQLAPSTNLRQLRNQVQLLTQSLVQLMARSKHRTYAVAWERRHPCRLPPGMAALPVRKS